MPASSQLHDIADLLAAAETVDDLGRTVEAPVTNSAAVPGRNGSRAAHSPSTSRSASSNGHHQVKPANGQPAPPMTTNETAKALAAAGDVLRLTCPCGRRLRVKREQSGKRIKCPKCGAGLVIRAPDPQPAARPASPATSFASFGQMADEIEAAAAGSLANVPAGRKTLSWSAFRSLSRRTAPPTGQTEADVQSCRLALLELGQSGDRRARDVILPFLKSPSSLLRQAAAAALGELEDPAFAGPLVRLLEDDSAMVRKAAVIALGKCGHRAAAKPLLIYGLGDPHLKFLASESVLKLGEQAVPELLSLVSSQDPGLALEAIVMLGKLADQRAVKSLISCVESRSPLLRCHAAEALGKIGDARARGALLGLLEDPDGNVRANAAAALARMPDPNSLVPLARVLSDGDADVRRSAALALGEIGDKRAAEPLARLLHVKDDELALVVSEALAKLGDKRALPRLLDLLQRPEESTQLKAIAALKRLGNPEAAPALYDALLCRSPLVRQRAVDALGSIGDAEAAERLEGVLRSDRATEVRAAAARALGEIADPVSVEALVRVLDDEFNVRCMALGALGAIGDEQALAPLLRAMEDRAPEIRFHAATALGNFKSPQAIEALQSAVADESEMVQRGASRSLEKLGAPINKRAAARLRRQKSVRSRFVEAHLALPALLATLWPDSGRGRAIVTGLVLAIAAGVFLIWPGSSTTSGGSFPIRGNVRALAFSPDGTRLALGRTFDLLEIWDPATGELVSERALGGTGEMAFAADSATLAIVAHDKLRLWKIGDSDSGSERGGHKSKITRLAATPSGRVIATLDESGRVLIWSLPDGEATAGLDIDLRGLKSIDITPDGSLLACGAARGSVVIWDTAAATPVHKFTAPGDAIAVAFNPDGSLLAAADATGTISVWDTKSGRRVAEFKEQSRTATLLRFHPDGKRLAAVTIATIWMWDLDSQKATALPALDADLVETLSFSPDGRYLAAGGSEDREAWIIDLDQGKVAGTLRAPK